MARLRNRMLNAEFWTDPELLRWPRDKRWFYQGLWESAEDSGCLENDAFGWKLILFPSPLDADITVEILATWSKELIATDGKLVEYQANGKSYLFLPTFHEHEHPRNPQPASLPLPPWVRWATKTSPRKDGGETKTHSYEVDTDTLKAYIEAGTTVVPTSNRVGTKPVPAPQSSPVQSSPDPSNAREPLPVENDGLRKPPPECSQANEDKEQEQPALTPSPPKPRSAKKFALPEPCDGGGGECPARMLNCVRHIVTAISKEHARDLRDPSRDFGLQAAKLVGYICTVGQDKLPTLDRGSREKACKRMMVDYWGRALAYHESDKGPIANLPAFVVDSIKHDDVVPDRLLEELRRDASAHYGESKAEALAAAG